MEENKKTSGLLYEDDFSFVTKDNELFLKGGSMAEKRKICDLDENEIEPKVQDLRKAFANLEQKVQDAAGQESVSADQVETLKEEARTAEAIGNFDELLKTIEELQQRTQTPESESGKEEASEETSAAKAEQEVPEEDKDPGTDAAEDQQDEETTDSVEDGDEEDAVSFYRSLVKKAEGLAKQNDWSYVTTELDNLSRQWGEGPDVDSEAVKKQFQKFTHATEKFEKRKKEHYQTLKEQKQKNLARKKELLSDLREIIDNKEWTATDKTGKIKSRWNSVGMLPSGQGEELDKKFNELIAVFNEHKVDRLVEKRQKEEDNLMLKLIVLDKMGKIVSSVEPSTKDWKKIDEAFDDLTKQWKKIGRVPNEKSNEVWERYKNAQDEYYDRKYKFDSKHRKQVDRFRSKKEKICEEAEALLEEQDLASAAREINKLHRRWKKIGNLPQRNEDELWTRFKSATDSFNARKSDNIGTLREQEEEHYRQKLELIKEAEAIKDTDEWDEGHRKMQDLMGKWKAIGPVPRKKSNKIWKQFKETMDVFYDHRRDHFKEIKEERKDNLKEKQDILDKLLELGQHEDPIEAVNMAKPLQEKFKDAGYVPIKKKNKIWKQYREACDVIYDRFRAAKSGSKFDQELAKADLDHDQRKEIQDMRKKFKKIKKEVHQLEEEVLQFKESKTYFKPTNKGNALRDEIQQKIDKAENELQKKQDQLDTIAHKMEEIKTEI